MLEQTTAPSTAAVTTAQAKAWLRVDHSTDDALIASLVRSVELEWEQATGIPMMVGTYRDQTCRGFSGCWSPPRQPVVSVTSVVRINDESGSSAAMDSADWRLLPSPGGQYIEIDSGALAIDEYAQITWTAGFAAVQPTHYAWALRRIAHQYRFRGDDPEGRGPAADNAEKWLRQSISREVLR